MNICAANEHIPAIEKSRMFKERHRCIRHGLPFKCIPKLMVIELNAYIAHYLNAFPSKGGVSQTMSPAEIVTGLSIDCNKHCRLEFGQYVQVHEESTPRNSMQARALELLP